MHSQRFGRPIYVTSHAYVRMIERRISDALLLDFIESGETRYKDDTRLWIYKAYADRSDNLLCAAAALTARAVIVKTVMHRFQLD